MTTATKIVTSRAPVKEVVKDASMVKQKEMMAAHYERLTSEAKDGDRLTVLLQRGQMSLYVAFTVGRG